MDLEPALLDTLTAEPARPVPLLPNVVDSSPVESASVDDVIDPMNDEEYTGDSDEEMVDYEATLERAK
jgi:hypothetical protein